MVAFPTGPNDPTRPPTTPRPGLSSIINLFSGQIEVYDWRITLLVLLVAWLLYCLKIVLLNPRGFADFMNNNLNIQLPRWWPRHPLPEPIRQPRRRIPRLAREPAPQRAPTPQRVPARQRAPARQQALPRRSLRARKSPQRFKSE
ncbi:Oidioi.mRNA.OKI2018_I69.chr1.g1236.t1.cds [Oikopleura dioica]|uniref:Oidioi.mRNA.OKI2018_I69.chr1.g1236.t1.cds n=1 Tax=Oikopleura dioica TaxID=34765 RepID=A0ABN7SRJ0_OIKDI|nr:Oidioi.mRNA.OKI2018_I69.chr1.g1236.t1.cds [Oikopleura dioica]